MLLSIGKPILDIIVEVDDNFLDKYGLKANDSVKATEEQAELFQYILKENPKFVPGGSVTNALRVYQWAMENKEKVFYIGIIGKDKFGLQIKSQLENENIDHSFFETGTETVQCAILISSNGRSRSMVSNSNLKATQTITNQDISIDQFTEKINQSSCFYVPAYSLILFSKIIKDIVAHFITHRKKIVVNLGATYILEKESENVKFLIKHANVVIGNEEEYQTLANIFNIVTRNLPNILTEVTSFGAPGIIFVVTSADKDVLVYTNENFKYFKVDSVQQLVDTTGAGDAFAGGFLTQYVKNSPLETCIYCGIACARHVVKHFGCDFDINFNRKNLLKMAT